MSGQRLLHLLYGEQSPFKAALQVQKNEANDSERKQPQPQPQPSLPAPKYNQQLRPPPAAATRTTRNTNSHSANNNNKQKSVTPTPPPTTTSPTFDVNQIDQIHSNLSQLVDTLSLTLKQVTVTNEQLIQQIEASAAAVEAANNPPQPPAKPQPNGVHPPAATAPAQSSPPTANGTAAHTDSEDDDGDGELSDDDDNDEDGDDEEDEILWDGSVTAKMMSKSSESQWRAGWLELTDYDIRYSPTLPTRNGQSVDIDEDSCQIEPISHILAQRSHDGIDGSILVGLAMDKGWLSSDEEEEEADETDGSRTTSSDSVSEEDIVFWLVAFSVGGPHQNAAQREHALNQRKDFMEAMQRVLDYEQARQEQHLKHMTAVNNAVAKGEVPATELPPDSDDHYTTEDAELTLAQWSKDSEDAYAALLKPLQDNEKIVLPRPPATKRPKYALQVVPPPPQYDKDGQLKPFPSHGTPWQLAIDSMNGSGSHQPVSKYASSIFVVYDMLCQPKQLVGVFRDGQMLKKELKIKNVGSVTWQSGSKWRTTDANGKSPSSDDGEPLSGEVKPGAILNFTARITMPTGTRSRRLHWYHHLITSDGKKIEPCIEVDLLAARRALKKK